MKFLIRTVAAAASVAALSAFAQDLDDDFGAGEDAAPAASAEDGETDGGGEAVAKAPGANVGEGRYFFTLPCCRMLEGRAEVFKPGATAWEPIEEGRFYPLGTSFRTVDSASRLRIQFGAEAEVAITGQASFGTRAQPLGEKTRTISLQSGVITLKLVRNLPDGLFKVSTPGFTVVNPKGESRYAYTRTVDGEAAQIRCVTGSLSVEGRHFSNLALKAANEVKIRSSQDQLFTGLYGTRGDCMVTLDQGLQAVKDFETGAVSTVPQSLVWKLSPKTAVRIHRALPSIGERMSVTIMTFDASGNLRNRCAFAEGRPEVNTGELGPRDSSGREEFAKKAAAAAEADVVDADIDADSDADSDSGDAGDSSDDAASSDDSSSIDDDFGF